MLIGCTCCGVTCGRFFVLLELLPSALSDVKIGSNDGSELVSSFGFLFLVHEALPMLVGSRLVVESEL